MIAAPSRVLPRRIILYPLAALLSVVLLYSAWLRETPLFWTNLGGHPFWHRQFVRQAFYPMLCSDVVLLSVLSWLAFTRTASTPLAVRVERVCLLLLWCTAGIIVAIGLANNLTNVIAGRPFHGHF